MTTNILRILCSVLLLSLFSCQSSPEKTSAPPNVVLIFMDDMGYGDLECYGHPTTRTPHLNQLAAEGIRFTSFYAPAAVCTPSRAGLLTGRYPVRNAPHNFGPESKTGLPIDELLIAEVLGEAGYATAAIGKWHLGHLPPYLPTARGFDSFWGLPYSNDMILPWCPWLTEADKLHLYQDSTIGEEIGKNQDDLTVRYTEQAVQFIQEKKDAPFFLYLAHSMPHLPISTADRFKGTSVAGPYGDVIETVDWSVGEIRQALAASGQAENTLIIFTSDNGPWHNLPERMLQDGVEPWHTGTSGILRGAKTTTYEGGSRVPGIFHWPGVIPAGQVSREMATAIDIFPTLLRVCEAKLPREVALDGHDLLAHLKGESASPRTDFFYSKGKKFEAIRQGAWKLRHTEAAGMELFHLDRDPAEMYNLAEREPEKVQELWQALQEKAAEVGAETYPAEMAETD